MHGVLCTLAGSGPAKPCPRRLLRGLTFARCTLGSPGLDISAEFLAGRVSYFIDQLFKNKDLFVFILCIQMLPSSTLHVLLVLTEARKGHQIPWTGVTDSSEPLCGCWELNPGSFARTASSFYLSHFPTPLISLFSKAPSSVLLSKGKTSCFWKQLPRLLTGPACAAQALFSSFSDPPALVSRSLQAPYFLCRLFLLSLLPAHT